MEAVCGLRPAPGPKQFCGPGGVSGFLRRRTGALRERRAVMIRDFIADVVNFFIDLLDRFLAIFGIDI